MPYKKLKVIAGARLEYNIQELKSADFTDRPIEVKNPVLQILPSLNVSYNFTEEMLIRAAYGMSVNRPEFRNCTFLDFMTLTIILRIKEIQIWVHLQFIMRK
ncbi:MAG: TonB-dependent receptor [Bacteroidetes bacterium]|nr:TonB-dependent receptor [Bacteroidota bacterium]